MNRKRGNKKPRQVRVNRQQRKDIAPPKFRPARIFGTPFGLATIALLLLAGWALLSAGILDTDLQRAARSGSVHAADGVALDLDAAARILGNRRLVVAFLEPGADLSDRCDETDGPAQGTLVLLLSRARSGADWDTYSCSRLGGDDAADFGKAVVAETTIANGTDQFVDRPLEALKVVAVNYDRLVRAGIVPDGARSISPSLPRYLVATAAIGAVLAGSGLAYSGARRAARLAADRRAERESAGDVRSSLGARAAVLARHIIELDHRYSRSRRDPEFARRYRTLVADYTGLLADLAGPDDRAGAERRLSDRVDELIDRSRNLSPGHSPLSSRA
jgi:hypothetical protein